MLLAVHAFHYALGVAGIDVDCLLEVVLSRRCQLYRLLISLYLIYLLEQGTEFLWCGIPGLPLVDGELAFTHGVG